VKIVDHIDNNTMIDRLTVRQRREFALWCAERVRHLMTDPRSTDALDVAARYLRGEATDEELTAADAAAWAAAQDLAAAVRAAAYAAAAAWDAAWAAARAAAGDAWAAARYAAQAAAGDAARAAAWDAAAAVRAAAAAAGDAAQAAELAAQHAELRRMLGKKKINPASSKKKGRKK
jgi:hypothetical protein